MRKKNLQSHVTIAIYCLERHQEIQTELAMDEDILDMAPRKVFSSANAAKKGPKR